MLSLPVKVAQFIDPPEHSPSYKLRIRGIYNTILPLYPLAGFRGLSSGLVPLTPDEETSFEESSNSTTLDGHSVI